MSNTNFKVGDKVVAGYDSNDDKLIKKIMYSPYGEGYIKGQVTEVLLKSKVKVLWDQDYQWHNTKTFCPKTGRLKGYEPAEVDADILFHEEEAESEIKSLEEAFSKVEKEIEEKIKIAGELIKQANNLVTPFGASLHQLDASHDLLSAMRTCGWRTSSMNC